MHEVEDCLSLLGLFFGALLCLLLPAILRVAEGLAERPIMGGYFVAEAEVFIHALCLDLGELGAAWPC